MGGRQKRALGDVFGLRNFGVNLTTLAPGARSALRHGHSLQDAFVYIITGAPTLIINAGEQVLQPGMCVGFRAGDGDAHCLINRSEAVVTYLEVGDRSAGDSVAYPDDDLMLVPWQTGSACTGTRTARPTEHAGGSPSIGFERWCNTPRHPNKPALTLAWFGRVRREAATHTAGRHQLRG